MRSARVGYIYRKASHDYKVLLIRQLLRTGKIKPHRSPMTHLFTALPCRDAMCIKLSAAPNITRGRMKIAESLVSGPGTSRA